MRKLSAVLLVLLCLCISCAAVETENGFAYDFTIPFGCTAELELPCGHKQTLTAGTYHFE